MGKEQSVYRCISALVFAAALAAGPSGASGQDPAPSGSPTVSLIYAGWFGNVIPTPAFLKANWAFLQTQPFQGIVAYLRDDATGQNATTGVMTGNPIGQATLTSIVSPLKGLATGTLADNFGLVQGSTPPDFFDDWSGVVQNFSDLASVLRDAGLRGIFFDNEQYAAPWGHYPAGAKYPSHTLSDYQTQARLRGSQVMQAMAAQFPAIAVLTLHGPYISELSAPASLGFPQWQSGNNLLGAFFAGMVDGAGSTALPVDGGELYTLRSDSDFANSYSWRKYTLPSDAVNCPFIPGSLRPAWPNRVSISFGVYDLPFGGAAMNPSIAVSTLTSALHHADRYVWFYTEGSTFLLPSSSGGASADWVGAVRQASSTVPVVTPPPAPAHLTATAVSSSAVALAWTLPGSGTTGVAIERKSGPSGSYAQIAQVPGGALSYQDGSLDPGTTYVYRVRTMAGTLLSDYSAESSVTTAPLSPTSGSETPPPVSGSSSSGASDGASSTPSAAGSGGGGGGGSCGLLGLDGLIFLLPLFAALRSCRTDENEEG